MISNEGESKMTTKYPEVEVALTGQDGNAFSIIGQVTKAIRRSVGQAEASEFQSAAMASESYDDLLRLVMATVEVS